MFVFSFPSPVAFFKFRLLNSLFLYGHHEACYNPVSLFGCWQLERSEPNLWPSQKVCKKTSQHTTGAPIHPGLRFFPFAPISFPAFIAVLNCFKSYLEQKNTNSFKLVRQTVFYEVSTCCFLFQLQLSNNWVFFFLKLT